MSGIAKSDVSSSESLARLKALTRIAGPDDPIYGSGPMLVSVRPSVMSISPADQKAIVERMRSDPKYKQA